MLLSGASGSMARGSSSSLSGSFSGGVETLTINRSDIGNPGTVQFYVTATGDSATTFGDDAPDGTAVWQYQIIVSAAPPPPPATPPAPAPAPPPSPPSPRPASPLTLAATKLTVGKATAGKPLSVTMAVSRSDTGSGLSGGRVACSARIGASALRATKSGPTGGVATCHWLVPKTARGRAIRGSITVTYHGAT